jgi:hypothetical protein
MTISIIDGKNIQEQLQKMQIEYLNLRERKRVLSEELDDINQMITIKHSQVSLLKLLSEKAITTFDSDKELLRYIEENTKVCSYCGARNIKMQQDQMDKIIMDGANEIIPFIPENATNNCSLKDRVRDMITTINGDIGVIPGKIEDDIKNPNKINTVCDNNCDNCGYCDKDDEDCPEEDIINNKQ